LKVLVTGSAGFIAAYLVEELLSAGHEVVGIDNFSKYGVVQHRYDDHARYMLVVGDAKDVDVLKRLVVECDVLVAAAAKVGGIGYFHAVPYDLFAENERIVAAAFDAAIWAHAHARLTRIVVVSSSMVFESATRFPTPEGAQLECPPPRSAYGFQKLASEYFARAAWDQYRLPYTIVRPFNCVGIGELATADGGSGCAGNAALALGHVVPDLARRALAGEDPLRILGSGRQVRHYTYGGDLGRGIRLCIESPHAVNEDFNLSTPVGTTVLQLADKIWRRVHPDRALRYVSEEPLPNDVQVRVPDVSKAQRLLGFQALTPLDAVLDEVIPWIAQHLRTQRPAFGS
jgi:UDP-glucose 4-epimerase